MEYWWKDSDRGILNNLGKNLYQFFLADHKFCDEKPDEKR